MLLNEHLCANFTSIQTRTEPPKFGGTTRKDLFWKSPNSTLTSGSCDLKQRRHWPGTAEKKSTVPVAMSPEKATLPTFDCTICTFSTGNTDLPVIPVSDLDLPVRILRVLFLVGSEASHREIRLTVQNF